MWADLGLEWLQPCPHFLTRLQHQAEINSKPPQGERGRSYTNNVGNNTRIWRSWREPRALSGSSQLLSAAFETLLMGVDDISQSGGGGCCCWWWTGALQMFSSLQSSAFCVCVKEKNSLFLQRERKEVESGGERRSTEAECGEMREGEEDK